VTAEPPGLIPLSFTQNLVDRDVEVLHHPRLGIHHFRDRLRHNHHASRHNAAPSACSPRPEFSNEKLWIDEIGDPLIASPGVRATVINVLACVLAGAIVPMIFLCEMCAIACSH
jgi:hypothetical protein